MVFLSTDGSLIEALIVSALVLAVFCLFTLSLINIWILYTLYLVDEEKEEEDSKKKEQIKDE